MATAEALASGERTEAPPRRRFRLPQALPHLEGRRGATVRAIYFALAIVTLVVIAGSFWFNGRDYFGNMPTAASYGFRTQTRSDGPAIAGVSGAEAEASGLRKGDRILAIDGKPLPASATEYTIAERLDASRDGGVTIVTRSEDGAVRTHALPRVPVTRATMEPITGLPLWLYIALGFASAQLPLLIFVAASLLLAWRRPRDPEAMLFAAALLMLCFNNSAAFWLYALAGVPSVLLNSLTNFGGCLLLAAMAGFPDGRFASGLSRVTLVLILVLAMLIPLSAATSLRLPTGLLFLVSTLGVLGSVWLRYRRSGGQLERQQIKWAVFSFCAGLSLLLPMQIASGFKLVPAAGPAPFFLNSIVPSLALLLIALGLLVSLLRYRLYDADAAISRSAGYTVLTLLLAATFAASAKGMEIFFETYFGREAGALPGALGAGLAVVLITPMHNRIHRWAERRFQKALLHLRRDLPLCVGDLRETAGLEQLLGAVLARIGTGVRATRSAMLLRDAEGWRIVAARDVDASAADEWRAGWTPAPNAEGLDCDARDPLFPMRIALSVDTGAEPQTIGWILLGPRPDGSFYGRDEQEALAEIADPVARAVQIVRLREERERQAELRMRRHEERFEALETLFARLAPKPG